MKAIAKVAPQKGVELVEKPMPEMGINDVLIKIKKTASRRSPSATNTSAKSSKSART